MFRQIYFDASALLECGWPALSTSFRMLAEIATREEVELFLPLPVEYELEVKWRKLLNDARAKIGSAMAEYKRHLARVKLSPFIQVTPEDDQALKAYRECVEGIKAEYRLFQVPFSVRQVSHFFEMAAAQVAPIGESDKGFRDAVILYSILDHLKHAPDAPAAFIVHDDAFYRPEVADQISKAGVVLQLYRTVPEMLEQLKAHISDMEKAEWDKQQQCALDFVNSCRNGLEQYLRDNLEMTASDLLGHIGGEVQVEDLHLNDVTHVLTPPPDRVPATGEVPLSMGLMVTVEFFADDWLSRAASPLPVKVGQKSTLQTVTSGIGPSFNRKDLTATVEARAVREQGKYVHIVYCSAIVGGFHSLLRDPHGLSQ